MATVWSIAADFLPCWAPTDCTRRSTRSMFGAPAARARAADEGEPSDCAAFAYFSNGTMSLRSAPSDTQTSKINSIYFARGHDGQCKSHDTGRDAKRGEWGSPAELLLVQGPLCLNWMSRKLGIVPRIEAGEISHDTPPTAQRVALWENCAVGIEGAPGHLFIKIHTHGCVDETMDMLFSSGFDNLWNALEARFRDRPGYRLHYVSAWDMYRKIHELAMPGPAAATANAH